MTPVLGRLIYLAAELHPKIPNRLVKLLQGGEIIKSVSEHGLHGASSDLTVEIDQLKDLYKAGKAGSTATLQEFKLLVVQQVRDELELKEDDMPFKDWLSEIAYLQAYLEGSDHLVVPEEISMSAVNPDKEPEFIKWNGGFEPIDLVTGGLYQGIIMLIAKPGTGKTSILLSQMEALRQNNMAEELWFFENEIPLSLMLYKTRAMRGRTQFLERDRLVCGMTAIQDIIKDCQEDPNPERVIFYDSPDVLAGGNPDQRRFVLESLYRELVVLKGLCKCVFVASQPRRKDGNRISIESGAEAWSKAWYSDIILGLTKLGQHPGGGTRMKLNIPKNRFGIADQELTFPYQLSDLSWRTPDGPAHDEGDWDEHPKKKADQEEEDW